jgi:hypothetical protein
MGLLSGMLPHNHLGSHPDCRKPQPIHPDKTELYSMGLAYDTLNHNRPDSHSHCHKPTPHLDKLELYT